MVGTAFFFAPQYLLTAAHNVRGNDRTYLRISLPQVHHVTLPESMSGIGMVQCNLVATVNGKNNIDSHLNDIAILQSPYFARYYLNLSKTPPPLAAKVNIVGYPARFTDTWIGSQPAIKDPDKGMAAAEILFPTRHLTVSQGTVTETGDIISYRLSSCPGMSGACVLYNDKVVGT